jgi:hypothetical protein
MTMPSGGRAEIVALPGRGLNAYGAIALPTGLVLGGGAVLAISLVGAGLGAWWSSLIGVSIGNRRIKDYEDAIVMIQEFGL